MNEGNMRILSLFFLLVPIIAFAQSPVLPELFTVTGIEVNEKLDIHGEAKQDATVIGSLASGAKGVEVIELASNGEWALVNGAESSGWVEARFLQAQPSVWDNGKLPQSLRCHGTEPFWNISFSAKEVRLKVLDAPERLYSRRSVSDRGFAGDRIRAVEAGDMTAVIFPKQCSDGMSDRTYALQAVISLRNSDRTMFAGCCSIAAN
ncbi:hypothetical protein [Brucella sp. NBRC 113783]|uniref:COG3650 family protein n=1 Tax=Brucella sp. NBRC 113783 TaxID=3075478 RepID=UPI0029C0DAEA|nr:hypothetical protein [Brucella sp. NBRC 113783]MDX4076556.1 hypothetical protein [Brucella sp. NBRC 113783]